MRNMIKKRQIKIKYIFINKIIADGLTKNLNSTKFTDFIKILSFKNRSTINNTVKRRLGVNI